MPRKVLCSFGNLLFDLSCRWQRSWGVAHRYSQLQSLTRLAHQNPDALIHLQGGLSLRVLGLLPQPSSALPQTRFYLLDFLYMFFWFFIKEELPQDHLLKTFSCIFSFLLGHTIVFADQSGMNSSGHVLLGTMDVHHQWTKVKQ